MRNTQINPYISNKYYCLQKKKKKKKNPYVAIPLVY